MTSLVFGGHSPIAISISKVLSKVSKVYHLSRSIDAELRKSFDSNENIELIEMSTDKNNHLLLSEFVDLAYHLNPQNIIFATRYRNSPYNPLHAYELEVMMPAELLTSYSKRKSDCALQSVVILGSPAGTKIIADQNVYYHANKAGLEQVIRFFSVNLEGVRVNGVLPGGFVIKARSQTFYQEHEDLRVAIENFLPNKTFVQVEDIAALVNFLCSNSSKQVNGQLIGVDGGYRNWEESAYLLSRFKQ
jgi:NAD(P)-dependent dehydrogenase (short-subunit alcohol dehydrogenase family)